LLTLPRPADHRIEARFVAKLTADDWPVETARKAARDRLLRLQPELDQPADGFRAGRLVSLRNRPIINGRAQLRRQPNRRAYQDWIDNLGEDDIEAAVPIEGRRSSIIDAIFGDPDWQVPGDDPAWIAHIETAVRTGAEHCNSTIALVSFDSLTSLVLSRCFNTSPALRRKTPRRGRPIWLTTRASLAPGIFS
jgi:hypothetical protein